MADFHNGAKAFADEWEKHCDKEPAAAAEKSVALKPAVLAYFVRGEGIGAGLRRLRDAQQRCLNLTEELSKLGGKKTLVGVEIDRKYALPAEIDVACSEAKGKGSKDALASAQKLLEEAQTTEDLDTAWSRVRLQTWSDEQIAQLAALKSKRQRELQQKALPAEKALPEESPK